jgi:hypothetical protein
MCVMRGLMVVVLVVVMGVGEEELVRVIVWGGRESGPGGRGSCGQCDRLGAVPPRSAPLYDTVTRSLDKPVSSPSRFADFSCALVLIWQGCTATDHVTCPIF